MDALAVANEARTFLKNYVLKKMFFSPPDVVEAAVDDPDDEEADAKLVLMFQHAVPKKDAQDELLIIFTCGRDLSEDDPAVVKAAGECMAAVKEALPNLAAYKIEVRIERR